MAPPVPLRSADAPPPDTLAERLRLRREELRMSQAELAGDRYTRAHVSRIEHGHHHPSSRALGYFAERLGVSAEYLLTGIRPDDRRRLELAAARAEGLGAQGLWEEARETLSAVWDDARKQPDDPLVQRLRVALANAMCATTRPDEAIRVLDEDRSWIDDDDPALVARGCYVHGWASLQADDLPAAVADLERAVEAAQAAEDSALAVRALSSLADAEQMRGNLALAERLLARALDVAGAEDDPAAVGRVLYAASLVAERRGDVRAAVDAAQRAIGAFHAAGWAQQVPRLRMQIGTLLLAQDRPEDALAHLTDVAADEGWSSLDRDRLTLQLSMARAHLMRADVDEAERALAEAERLAATTSVHAAQVEVARWRSAVHRAAGDSEAALRVAEAALDAIPDGASAELREELILASARALEDLGRDREALARYREFAATVARARPRPEGRADEAAELSGA